MLSVVRQEDEVEWKTPRFQVRVMCMKGRCVSLTLGSSTFCARAQGGGEGHCGHLILLCFIGK